MWKDEELWEPEIDELSRYYARQRVESFTGFDKLRKAFDVEEIEFSYEYYNAFNAGYRLDLEARDPTALVDAVGWINPSSEDGVATQTAIDLLDQLSAYRSKLDHFPWVREWKKGRGERTIAVGVIGSRGFIETDPGFQILPAWKRGAFEGDIWFAVELFIGEDSCGTIYFSRTDSRALIYKATVGDKEAPHWFDRLESFDFHPNTDQPTFVVVTPIGKTTRIVMTREEALALVEED